MTQVGAITSDFYDPDGYLFEKGVDEFGGKYDDDLNYIPPSEHEKEMADKFVDHIADEEEDEEEKEEKEEKEKPEVKGISRGHHKNDIPFDSEEFNAYVHDTKVVPTLEYLDNTDQKKVIMKINNVNPQSSNAEFREFLSENDVDTTGVIFARPTNHPTNVNFFLKVEARDLIVNTIKLEGVKFGNRRLIVQLPFLETENVLDDEENDRIMWLKKKEEEKELEDQETEYDKEKSDAIKKEVAGGEDQDDDF